jgi:hypothetical protein
LRVRLVGPHIVLRETFPERILFLGRVARPQI